MEGRRELGGSVGERQETAQLHTLRLRVVRTATTLLLQCVIVVVAVIAVLFVELVGRVILVAAVILLSTGATPQY